MVLRLIPPPHSSVCFAFPAQYHVPPMRGSTEAPCVGGTLSPPLPRNSSLPGASKPGGCRRPTCMQYCWQLAGVVCSFVRKVGPSGRPSCTRSKSMAATVLRHIGVEAESGERGSIANVDVLAGMTGKTAAGGRRSERRFCSRASPRRKSLRDWH